MSLRISLRRVGALAASVVSALTAGTVTARAQTGANVLVVVNRDSADSEAIASRYAERRHVPPQNVCGIHVTAAESIARDAFEERIEDPIWKCIGAIRAQDRILYILLTKGIPIRVSGTLGRAGTNASVDSELTLLYRRRSGTGVPLAGSVVNPYFAGDAAANGVRPFGHDAHDIYLVTRLDGYTRADALALIDRGAAPSPAGARFVLDERVALVEGKGDTWLRAAADRLQAQGFADRVVLDETKKGLIGEQHVLGYYSWGSNDEALRARSLSIGFVPGAIAGMFLSSDARTFKEPPADWVPSADNASRDAIYAGSHQSLAADLIREGVTGVSGFVNEPYMDGAVRPDILFPAYAAGRNLAEAFYAAIPSLSWQGIVIGDPLCAPFPRAPQAAEQVDPPYDEATELPIYFSKRRLRNMPGTLNAAAAAAFVRAESRNERADPDGLREALEAAVAAEPKFTLVRLELGIADQRDGRYDSAIKQYREILAYNPADAVALNNLAFVLSVYRDNPEEALPFAERACALSRNPAFLDTLAWIRHLLKQDAEAAALIYEARSGAFQDDFSWQASTISQRTRDIGREHQNPELLVHAAVIYASINDLGRASSELKLALARNPELARRDDVKKLRQQLDAAGK